MKNLEFKMGDKIFVKVAPYMHVMRFNKKRKIALRFMQLLKVLECVSMVIYLFALATSTDCIRNVFNMSLLHKYVNNLTHVLRVKDVEVKENLAYKGCLI